MEVFLQIRRKNTTIFTDAKEEATVMEVKKMIEGILKIPTDQMQLHFKGTVMDDDKKLSDFDLDSDTAKAPTPANLGLAIRDPTTGDFEPLEITPYSIPPEVPEILRPRHHNDEQQA